MRREHDAKLRGETAQLEVLTHNAGDLTRVRIHHARTETREDKIILIGSSRGGRTEHAQHDEPASHAASVTLLVVEHERVPDLDLITLLEGRQRERLKGRAQAVVEAGR